MVRINLRHPTDADSEILLVWRNSSQVRKASGNQEYISPNTHENWFAKRLENLQIHPFWMVELLNRPVGFIRLDFIEIYKYEISIVIAPEVRGGGLGKQALNLAILQFYEKFKKYSLVARVRKENFASLNLFYSSGFLQIREDQDYLILEHKIIDHGNNVI
jgi:RimJ/RimL family protein N-acetyltransferase